MSIINVNLSYITIAQIFAQEFNKQKIEFRSYPISIQNLTIEKKTDQQFFIFGDIISKWSAHFTLSCFVEFNKSAYKVNMTNIQISFNSRNILFKGLLNIGKSIIEKKISEFADNPLHTHLQKLMPFIDVEMNKTKLLYELKLTSKTHEMEILNLEFLPKELFLKLNVDQEITINQLNQN